MFKISPNANSNYLAQFVKLKEVRKHPNADRLQLTTIQGNTVIVSMDAKEGDEYVFFPLESALNKEFLSWSNSFSDKLLNSNQEVTGFFNNKGRVRAVKLRGTPSEGYAIPLKTLVNWLRVKLNKEIVFRDNYIGMEFDTFGDILICEKYINPVLLQKQKNMDKKAKGRKANESKLIDGQFHFHIDTPQLKKFVENISPNDFISITQKYHGTSAVVSKILCRKKLSLVDKIAKFFGAKVVETQYDMVYSSRRVIKNTEIKGDTANHFYSHDIWGSAAKSLEDALEPGITLYIEIVGFTEDGGYIQPKYDYGCAPNKFDVYVYRVTHTDCDGRVFEYSAPQVEEYCMRKGIKPVETYYYGLAKDLFNISMDTHWHQNFLDQMCNMYLEKDCPYSKNKVPDEGIVLRRDVPNQIDVYKLKSFRFFMMETEQLDNDNFVDMESSDVSEA
jgi:hypothetical protein